MEGFQGVFAGASVLVTGHTGFKGAWLTAWLTRLGARVTGFALDPVTRPNLFSILGAGPTLDDGRGDMCDSQVVERAVMSAQPDFVFHLAAQPLVRASYQEPAKTFETNVMGTVHLLNTLRRVDRSCTVVVVTSDKCYDNREWVRGYREDDSLGGRDPYSASKACQEIVAASYRQSFFSGAESPVRIASARAGNVIGGGDWNADRIVVDCVGALTRQEAILVRNPNSTRPWQHVLDPLSGYLWLAARVKRDSTLAQAWNFGPSDESVRSVRDLVEAFIAAWGNGAWKQAGDASAPREADLLSLSCEKARQQLGWTPTWSFSSAVRQTTRWYRAWAHGKEDLRALTLAQIGEYEQDAAAKGARWVLPADAQ